MAYAFQSINNLLDQTEQQKANIFGTEGQAAQGATSSGQIGQQEQVKSDVSSQLGTGGAGGATSEATQQQPSVTDARSSDRAAVQAAVGKVKEPKALGDVRGSLQEASSNLQNEANQYVSQSKQAHQYRQGEQDLEKAIAGDEGARQKAAGLISRKSINQVEAFKPQTDYDIEDVALLNNDAGLKQLAARGMGPQYSAGEAAFDVRALRKTPGFDNLIRQIQGEQQNLRKSAQELQTGKQKEVEDYARAELEAAQKGARDYLGSQQSALEAQNASEAAQWNKKLQEMRQGGVPESERQRLVEEAKRGVLSGMDPRYAAVADRANVDLNPYVGFADEASGEQFYDEGEAQRFNAILGLLGQGGQSRMAAKAPESFYGVDETGLQNSYLGALEKARGDRDAEQRQAVEKILAELGTKGKTMARDRLVSVGQESAALRDQIQKEMGVGSVYVPPDLRQYYNDARDYGALDYADQATADQLNAIYQDLGDPTRVGVGRYHQGSGFNRDAYANALRSLISGLPPPPAPAAKPGPARSAGGGSTPTDPNSTIYGHAVDAATQIANNPVVNPLVNAREQYKAAKKLRPGG